VTRAAPHIKIRRMCGQHIVIGVTRTLSSILPAPFKTAAKDQTAPRALPSGARICAPAKARCWIAACFAAGGCDPVAALLLRHRDGWRRAACRCPVL